VLRLLELQSHSSARNPDWSQGMRISSILLLTVLLTVSGCQQNGDLGPEDSTRPTPLPTTPTTPVVQVTRIEFRVNGTSTTARIRYTNAVDGTTQIITSLPYVTTVTTQESFMFVTLEATPVSYTYTPFPFMSVQIFVNGVLFREAVSDNLLNPLSVAGTWRR
jgi:hypothetical protein